MRWNKNPISRSSLPKCFWPDISQEAPHILCTAMVSRWVEPWANKRWANRWVWSETWDISIIKSHGWWWSKTHQSRPKTNSLPKCFWPDISQEAPHILCTAMVSRWVEPWANKRWANRWVWSETWDISIIKSHGWWWSKTHQSRPKTKAKSAIAKRISA